MKLRCEVLAVQTDGDSLSIRWQARQISGADWRPMLSGTIALPVTRATQRAYHVGRVFEMELSPRPGQP